jgi:hypothetical protein
LILVAIDPHLGRYFAIEIWFQNKNLDRWKMATWFWLSFQWLRFLVATNPHLGCSPTTKIQSQKQK